MKYDFDKVVDRHGTNCLKYDFAIERGKPADILPLWVADMDFQTAPAILERLEETVKHGIFGYSDGKEGYFAAVQNWYRERWRRLSGRIQRKVTASCFSSRCTIRFRK